MVIKRILDGGGVVNHLRNAGFDVVPWLVLAVFLLWGIVGFLGS